MSGPYRESAKAEWYPWLPCDIPGLIMWWSCTGLHEASGLSASARAALTTWTMRVARGDVCVSPPDREPSS